MVMIGKLSGPPSTLTFQRLIPHQYSSREGGGTTMSCEDSYCICDVIHNGGSHSRLPFHPLSTLAELHLSIIRPQVRIRQSIYPL